MIGIILATVAAVIYEFTAQYPRKLIYFTGSTPERTRLYRMAIAINFATLAVDFDIYGVISRKSVFYVEQFKRETNYYGFLIKRKIS